MTQEHDIAIFLIGLALLLLVARLLGEAARALKLPAVAGELFAGVLLGPTLLGRFAPGSVQMLFPAGLPKNMLSGYTLLASVLLLTLAGLEIDLSVVIQRRREAALTSFAGVLVPMLLGIGFGLILPDSLLVDPSKRVLFALFIGTALSISAMPVIAKTLLDLGLYRTDIGLLVMAAAMLDDLLGWMLFSLLIGPMHGAEASFSEIAWQSGGVIVFVLVVLVIGRPLFDRLLSLIERERMSAPSRVLSMVIVLSLLGAALTQSLGVHAVFGAFIVGVALGDSPKLRAETRSHIHELVSNIFAPVFFAAVGLRVDFIGAFSLPLVLGVVLIACLGKLLGCTVGAALAGMPKREALSVGFAMNSRGAMEIILALVAFESGLIGAQLFVALVMMALVTSLLAGPAMTHLLRTRPLDDIKSLLEEGAVVLDLRARNADQAVRELTQQLTVGTPLDSAMLSETILEQDVLALGGLENGIALPHARVKGLPRTMLALGRSSAGIDFNATDGSPAKLIFLLLIPEAQSQKAVELQAAVMRVVATPLQRESLSRAISRTAVLQQIAAAQAIRPEPPQGAIAAPLRARLASDPSRRGAPPSPPRCSCRCHGAMAIGAVQHHVDKALGFIAREVRVLEQHAMNSDREEHLQQHLHITLRRELPAGDRAQEDLQRFMLALSVHPLGDQGHLRLRPLNQQHPKEAASAGLTHEAHDEQQELDHVLAQLATVRHLMLVVLTSKRRDDQIGLGREPPINGRFVDASELGDHLNAQRRDAHTRELIKRRVQHRSHHRIAA